MCRLTWQATAKQKLTFFESVQDSCNCYMTIESNRAPEAANNVKYWPVTLTQASWSYPLTNRLLLQAGVTYGHNPLYSNRMEGVTTADIPFTESTTGFLYNARTGIGLADYGYLFGHQHNERVSVSYITGSHAFKAGLFYYHGFSENLATQDDRAVAYTLRNQLPVSVTYYAAPQFWRLTERQFRALRAGSMER